MNSRLAPLPADVPDIRDAVNASIADAGLRPTARDVGMSPTGLRLFATAAHPYPYSATLRRLRRWYAKHASMEDNDG